MRSKGIFWLASRPENAILWGQAGDSRTADIYGRWWASVSLAHRANSAVYLENQEEIQAKWDSRWGDRMIEIVFIGKDMDVAQITKDLNACQLTDEEIAIMDTGVNFSDDWPL